MGELIETGKQILVNPDKPKFLEAHVERIEVGWDDTKEKAQDRLTLLNNTKDAWVGYAENNDTIIIEIEKGLEEIKKVKKRFNLQSAFEDLAKRQEIFNKTKDSVMGLYNEIKHNVEVMSLTIPEDKKKLIEKEIKALSEKLVVVSQFEEKVNKIDDFCKNLNEFDGSLKSIDAWMTGATNELNDIKNSSDKMAPEDRVARTMDLQEDIAAKFEIIKANTSRELELLPQGDKVPGNAQEVKFWAEYGTGIKEFSPWLVKAEAASTEGLSKPSNLDEASALAEKVHGFEKACVDHLKVLEAADSAAKKMTTHKEADDEVAALKQRYMTVKSVADDWVAKVDTLVKEWQLLDNTVTELNTWVAKDKTTEGENQFSLEKMESTLGELKNIFKQKEKLVDGL